ncbi:MAG TPA: pyruvate dehydrogenase complex dihydrolipoamide acetyltransferase [Pyrinomonadaceae bacterium]|nr:pyruvate dehydrogenase complex dihydrolipoamide acetyltransferase [Pyrinomonadaceae bacterium]
MATQVVMPKLSPTMEEGQLSRWLKKEGDKVSVGEPIAEIDTDKATMEAQALAEGVLRKILVPEGTTVPLGQVIAVIGSADEDISGLLSEAASPAAAAENKERIEESVQSRAYGAQSELAEVKPDGARTQATIQGQPLDGEVGGQPGETQPQPTDAGQKAAPSGGQRPPGGGGSPSPAPGNGQRGQQGGGRLVVSPLAARMAAEAGINLQTLSGSGPGGRIVKRDIEAAMSSGRQQQPAAETQAAPQPQQRQARAAEAPAAQEQQTPAPVPQPQPLTQPGVEGLPAYREQPLSTMRATIARRLVTSIGPIPHFFLTTEIEMDKAADLRRQINEIDPELKVSLNDIIIKVAAVALVQHPAVNASFHEKSIRHYERADIGVAVAVEDGLITPVVRSANTKTVGQISREVRELAERARTRRLKPEEYTGATFSVSNLGMFGIDDFTAVINPPEAAILAVGAATPKPVVRDGQIVVRQIMRVTMSCDHRVVDGATGAKFLQTLKKILENPLLLMV